MDFEDITGYIKKFTVRRLLFTRGIAYWPILKRRSMSLVELDFARQDFIQSPNSSTFELFLKSFLESNSG
ncbi:MAG: hypothetical protein HRT57_13570 [Crocinitomicaceae bacterium]|nr:hypothetical protein [Crocinitomicaceae bacterium]